jgi:hypothetical protein
MMDDNRLLKFAAKAAGICIESWTVYGPYVGGLEGCIWNPIAENGDALRLAVRLGLAVLTKAEFTAERPIVIVRRADVDIEQEIESNHDEAVRRAIVRAAAEIGKSMP